MAFAFHASATMTVSFIFVSAAITAFASPTPSAVPAMFVFGDSTADVGNNNYLDVDETRRANYPHNGIDYFPASAATRFSTDARRTGAAPEEGCCNSNDKKKMEDDDEPHTLDDTRRVDLAARQGKPTGRFSNGYIGVDYMAQAVGLDTSPPAYLSLGANLSGQIRGGVNFASGGSGILDTTGDTISMNTQISYFRKVVGAITGKMGREMASSISKSLFLISTANNDLFAYYSARASDRNATADDAFVSSLVLNLRQQLKELHGLGGRRFWILGTAEIGCTPAIRRLSPTSPDCIEALNELSRLFNELARPMLVELAALLEGMRYAYADAYYLSALVERSPSLFGFKETKKACCGHGYLNGEYVCNADAAYCSRRRDFRYWDWYHPTDAYYQLVAVKSFSGSLDFVAPVNVETLIRM